MAATLVQTKSGSSGGYNNSFSFTFNSNVTAGSLLVLNLTAGNADILSTVADNNSNTWIEAVNTDNSETGERQTWLYYVANANSGSTQVTVTYDASDFPDTAYIAREYSGIATSSPLDQTSTANDGASYVQTHSAGTTGTTTQATELVILGGGTSGDTSPTLVAGSGYGNGLEQKGFDLYTYAFMSDKTVTSTGTQTGNFTSTTFVRGQGFIATFKEIVVSTNKGFTLTMMGV